MQGIHNKNKQLHKRRPQTKWITFRVNVYNIDFLLSKVYAYDPTVSFPPLRGNSISFQKLGVAAKRLTMMMTLAIQMRSKFNASMDLVTIPLCASLM